MSWISYLWPGNWGRKPQNTAIVPGTETFDVLMDWINAPTTIDKDLRRNLKRQRDEARTLAVTNPIVRQYLALLSDNVIGAQGMKLQAQVRKGETLDKTSNDTIEAGWRDFWRSPWVDGRTSGVIGEHLALKTVANDGECFVRMVSGYPNKFGFALQMLDADLVDHTLNVPRGGRFEGQTVNEIRLGIEVDEWGRAVAMWVWDSLPDQPQRTRKRIPASEILHLYDPERMNQTRGITWHNAVIVPLKMLDGAMEAEVTAFRAGACQMMVFKQAAPPTLSSNGQPANINYNIDARPGGGVTLPPGLEMQQFDPNHPNADVPAFVKSLLRYCAGAWRVSYNALANDLEGVNYSSIRSGLLIERDHWQVLQQWWIDRFRQPVFEAWLRAALLTGGLRLGSRDPANYTRVRWIPRGWDWVDPLKDVTAAEKSLQLRLTSRRRLAAKRGDDLEEIFEEIDDERKLAVDYEIDLESAPTDPAMLAALLKDDDDLSPDERRADHNRALALVAAHRGG